MKRNRREGDGLADLRLPSAIACAVYVAKPQLQDATIRYVPLMLAAQLVEGVRTACQAEATALDWSLDCWKDGVESEVGIYCWTVSKAYWSLQNYGDHNSTQ
eukprot:gnl/MRDRNA2_/MRDRNA2_19586_c0_seq1.p1 gnl/MRDRNA2_/MRDRNA2_19586_c0~~gnl/MRDRNA2_/MRDRNA2_19586_c0_seq1.p1  ORF type:complete len:102 (-),score=11.18 gnl/MRDRNA2_/MRDRNA2_19586_c0_seq1:258-563(-)